MLAVNSFLLKHTLCNTPHTTLLNPTENENNQKIQITNTLMSCAQLLFRNASESNMWLRGAENEQQTP